MKPFNLQPRIVKFAADVIKSTEKLKPSYASDVLKKQAIRSSISSALNYGEAQAGVSNRDFINKMGISNKELRETQINFEIQKEAELIEEQIFQQLHKENSELIAIFTSSIKTARNRLKNSNP